MSIFLTDTNVPLDKKLSSEELLDIESRFKKLLEDKQFTILKIFTELKEGHRHNTYWTKAICKETNPPPENIWVSDEENIYV